MEAAQGPLPYRFNGPREERIHGALERLIGEGSAAFYRDATRLVQSGDSLEATSHFVGHAVREIESAILDVCSTPSDQEIAKQSKEAHRTRITTILSRLSLTDSDPGARAWLRRADDFHMWAHRRRLDTPRIANAEFLKFWSDTQVFLDSILTAMEAQFVTWLNAVDGLLRIGTPTRADVGRLSKHIPNTLVVLNRFFGNLSSPAWLPHLKKAGFFSQPPGTRRDGDLIYIPPWPQMRYLTRMASVEPRAICDILLDLPHTGNSQVVRGIMDAALAMPVSVAAELVPRISQWVDRGLASVWVNVGDFVSKLAEGGHEKEALAVLRQLLELRRSQSDSAFASDVTPVSGISESRYAKLLEQTAPKLVAHCGLDVLRLVCDLLNGALLARYQNADEDGGEDFSEIWCPSVRSIDDRHARSIKAGLVSAVRDTAMDIESRDRSQLPGVLTILSAHKWRIFHRIALHVISASGMPSAELLSKCLLDRDTFDDLSREPEYVSLLRSGFALLSNADQSSLLQWIDAGPDSDWYARWTQRIADDPASRAEIDGHAEKWKLDRLHLVKDHLTPRYLGLYADLLTKHGPAHSFGPQFETTRWASPTSPITMEEIGLLEPSDLADYLNGWVPSGGFDEPCREGLANALRSAVSSDPVFYASAGAELRRVHEATYVRAIVEGLMNGVGRLRFRWRPVLALCRYVMDQSVESCRPEAGFHDGDHDWESARYAVADLFNRAFGRGSRLPHALRAEAWHLTKTLARHIHLCAVSADVAASDTYRTATESTREKAMRAVLRYALRVYERGRKQNRGNPYWCSFDLMPEVREELEWHLDPVNDGAAAIRSVYGEFYPQLLMLDRDWSLQHATTIFPAEAESEALRVASWTAYIVYNHPYNDVYRALRDQYAEAIERVGTSVDGSHHFADPDEHLGQHLMLLHARGVLGRVADQNPLCRLFEIASDKLRAELILHIGHGMGNNDGPSYTSDFVGNLTRFWEWRVCCTRSSPSLRDHRQELAAFGWWFISGCFPEEWAVLCLVEVLQLVGRVEMDDGVAEKLVDVCDNDPETAVCCIEMMLEGAQNRWDILWLDHARVILEKGRASVAARCNAIVVANKFLSHGFDEFHDLSLD